MAWPLVVVTWIHIATGTVALLAAPLALVARKGGSGHRAWGKAYFWAMVGVFSSGLALLISHPNVMFLTVGIFGFVPALAGYREFAPARPGRVYRHGQYMLCSYIAVVTSVLVQTVAPTLMRQGIPAGWVWLVQAVPLIIGLSGLAVWSRRYKPKASISSRVVANALRPSRPQT